MPMQRNKIQVALVDDHPALMEGLKTILLNNPDVNIAGCFVTGEAILNYVGSYPVDIVLLDIALPDISGIALCLEIRKKPLRRWYWYLATILSEVSLCRPFKTVPAGIF